MFLIFLVGVSYQTLIKHNKSVYKLPSIFFVIISLTGVSEPLWMLILNMIFTLFSYYLLDTKNDAKGSSFNHFSSNVRVAAMLRQHPILFKNVKVDILRGAQCTGLVCSIKVARHFTKTI